MREILFRGKRIDNGEWVEGYIVPYSHNTYKEGVEIIDTDGINYDELDYNYPAFRSYPVYPETVSQFTGLTDKNGVKIFEGDIVKGKVNTVRGYRVRSGVIEYYIDSFMLKVGELLSDKKHIPADAKVIGNIFDNRELMEGGGSDE